MQSTKKTFSTIFIILAVAMVILPFMGMFNDILTRLVQAIDAYQFIEKVIVPWEARMVGVLLYPLGFEPALNGGYLELKGVETPFLVNIAWNCIGWQSLLFFLITAIIGLQGDKYSTSSKIKALVIGFLGTFLINIVRIWFVVLTAVYWGQFIASLVHDYGSTIAVLAWLFFFWWFTYAYVLIKVDTIHAE